MSAPRIQLDTSSATPAYEQIRAQIAGLIAAGTLQSGDRLPTVRALAADLGIAVNTAARAYRELETTGLIATRRRAGTVVAEGLVAPEPAIAKHAQAFARAALAGNLDETTAIDLIRAAIRAARPA